MSGRMTLACLSSTQSGKPLERKPDSSPEEVGFLRPSLENADEHIYLQLSGGYHTQLMLHPPQRHHCLGLKAKGGKVWVSVRGSPGNSTLGGWGSVACKRLLPLKINSPLRLFLCV